MRFPASPRGLLSCWVTLHVLRPGSGGFVVVGPGHPVHGTVGQDVVLPCRLAPHTDAQRMEILWIRHRFLARVHHYRNGEDQDREQSMDYQGRTELVRAGLASGRLDLRILHLRPSDDGRYLCSVKGDTSSGEAAVVLKVSATGSDPQLSLEAHEDGGIRVRCRSAGWYPEPQVLWKGPGGQRLPSRSQRRSSDQRGLFHVEDVAVVSGSDRNFSCVVRNNLLIEEQESSLHISAAFFSNYCPWTVALPVLLVLLVASWGLGAWLWRRRALQRRELEKRSAALAERDQALDQRAEELEQRASALEQRAADLEERDQALGEQAALLAWRKFLLPENPDVVTLDPETAHPQLVLSPDRRRVTLGSVWQDLPDTPERFRNCCCVLGREGFREGRHCWEVAVDVGDGSRWAVGVSRGSVEWKIPIDPNPEEGIWAVWHFGGHFLSLTSPLTLLSGVPRRILVCLDCTEGLVTFINAETGAQIFTFPPGSLKGTIFRPWFWVDTEDTQLCLRGGSPQPLRPPPSPAAAPASPGPSPLTPRSPLLGPAAADAPLSAAPAREAEGH